MRVAIPQRKKARIEMLPLIDIVFLLLVVFIYAMLSMAVHRGLDVVLPAAASTVIDKRSMLSITVAEDGAIYLDKESVALAELSDALNLEVGRESETGVLLFADRRISYQQLFRVLDEIRGAGVTRISLQAELND